MGTFIVLSVFFAVIVFFVWSTKTKPPQPPSEEQQHFTRMADSYSRTKKFFDKNGFLQTDPDILIDHWLDLKNNNSKEKQNKSTKVKVGK